MTHRDDNPAESFSFALLESVVCDLDKLLHSYMRSGKLQGQDAFGAEGAMRSAPTALSRSIYLCNALLRNVVGRAGQSGDVPCPVLVTVFGGTQVGKSTVVNVLAGFSAARVHHTAGFTRHAQAFVPPEIAADQVLDCNPLAFREFDRVPQEMLAPDRPKEYSVTTLTGVSLMANTVLWDAPDCDAVDAALYQQGLIEALTVADVVVYVTSREKYAIHSILDWVLHLHRAGMPMAACLNMTPLSQQDELLADQRHALRILAERQDVAPAGDFKEPGRLSHFIESCLPAVAFDYAPQGDVSLLYGADYAPANALRILVQSLGSQSQSTGARQRRAVAAMDYIQFSLPAMLRPANRELKAWEEWEKQVAAGLEQFVDDYRRNYLDDPQRYDAFKRVGLEILILLNPPIPGLQKTLMAVRTVLSLPARAILFGGKALWRIATPQGRAAAQRERMPNEVAAFREAHDRLLNQLARFSGEKRRESGDATISFWNRLEKHWGQRIPRIEMEFRTELAAHRAKGDKWIKETAEGIYGELAKDPIKLNLLRTGRIAADAGAIVVSIKTGGHGDILHDLIVAPALMSVIEAITQQLASSYVDQRRKDLRDKLVTNTRLFTNQVYGNRLKELGRNALADSGFSQEEAKAFATLDERIGRLKTAVAEGPA